MEEEKWNRLMADALRGVRIPYTGKVWLGPEPTVTKPNDGVVFVDLSPAIGSIERTKYGKEAKCRGNLNGNEDFPRLRTYVEKGFGSSSSAPPCALRKWPRTANGRLPAKWVMPKSNTRAPSTFLTKGAELGY